MAIRSCDRVQSYLTDRGRISALFLRWPLALLPAQECQRQRGILGWEIADQPLMPVDKPATIEETQPIGRFGFVIEPIEVERRGQRQCPVNNTHGLSPVAEPAHDYGERNG